MLSLSSLISRASSRRKACPRFPQIISGVLRFPLAVLPSSQGQLVRGDKVNAGHYACVDDDDDDDDNCSARDLPAPFHCYSSVGGVESQWTPALFVVHDDLLRRLVLDCASIPRPPHLFLLLSLLLLLELLRFPIFFERPFLLA